MGVNDVSAQMGNDRIIMERPNNNISDGFGWDGTYSSVVRTPSAEDSTLVHEKQAHK